MSPFVSKSQRGYLYVHHPEIAREFEKKTVSIKALPEHVKKKRKDEGPPKPKGY